MIKEKFDALVLEVQTILIRKPWLTPIVNGLILLSLNILLTPVTCVCEEETADAVKELFTKADVTKLFIQINEKNYAEALEKITYYRKIITASILYEKTQNYSPTKILYFEKVLDELNDLEKLITINKNLDTTNKWLIILLIITGILLSYATWEWIISLTPMNNTSLPTDIPNPPEE